MKTVGTHFGPVKIGFKYKPTYNIAPSMESAVVVNIEGTKKLTEMKWGLIPGWAKNERLASKLINARSETVHEKPSFKGSLINKRCLIPADGFLEWAGVEKQPQYIHLKDQHLFAFAGLWSNWKSNEGKTLNTFTILTTQANEKLTQIHPRMPVILPPENYSTWLNPNPNLETLKNLLKPYPSEEFIFHPVSKEVNSPKNNHSGVLRNI